jgi:hypothetical protein|tara:strand:+ start:5841 stop:6014 length:174 start_codon:yes stop_codon:yes gene_type:complete
MQNHETTEAELYRKAVITLESKVRILENEVAKEQEMKYTAYKRIAELNSEINALKCE